MQYKIDKKKIAEDNCKRIQAGNILIASPGSFGIDSPFINSIIYILDTEDGASGIIINKQSTLTIAEAIPELSYNEPLFFGGNNQVKNVSYMHKMDIEDSVPIKDGLKWGGDYEQITDLLNYHKISPKDLFFHAGHVTWLPNQLQEEVMEGKWFCQNFKSKSLFSIYKKLESDQLWGIEMSKAGYRQNSMFSNFKIGLN